jgi:hypothetical protein
VLAAQGYRVIRHGATGDVPARRDGGATLAVIDPERTDCALLERRYERDGVRVVVASPEIPAEFLGTVREVIES